jgi:uncharacterized membrane protein HdeD (DUF308 family)
MLRNIVLVLGGTLIAAGLVALIGGSFAPALIAMVWGAVIVFGILYERYAYKTFVDRAPTGKYWVKTTERFVDEKSGKTVTVHTNTVTGERAYVAE